MKYWKLWVGVLILLLLIARLVYRSATKGHSMAQEREWYARQLAYDISIRVDTVIFHSQHGKGLDKVSGTITRGQLNPELEDSLGHVLKYFDRLWFNESKLAGKVMFPSPVATICQKGDSIVIQSDHNQVIVYRGQEQKRKAKLSSSLRGKLRPKKKK